MKFFDIFRLALSTFRNNKMRTFLTIFGVSIGIGTVVFLFSVGYGIQKITIGEITSIKALTTYNVSADESAIIKLDNDTIKKISLLDHVKSVTKNYTLSGQVAYNQTKTDLIISAVESQYVDLESPSLAAGQLFSKTAKDSIVLTTAITEAFGASADSLVDKKITLSAYIPNPADNQNPTLFEHEYQVSGIIKDNSTSYAYVPLSSIKIPAGSVFSLIKVQVDDTQNMTNVKEKLTNMGLQSTSVGEKVDQMNKIFRIAEIILIIIGAIALFVASIGMFNTLTISLLERTKDIGIMKSLGATDREIYFIFLTESSLISFAGGIFGIILSSIIGSLINLIIAIMANQAGGEPAKIVQLPSEFALIILLFSLIIGILTGIYPSRRAARLNPLDALRYE